MAVPTVTGARGTGNTSAAALRPDIGKLVLELEPNEYPFTTWTKRLRKDPTTNPKFSWFEDDLEPRADMVNGTVGTGTSITVDNGAYFAEHDLVRVMRTGEVIRVTAVATNTLTVVRGVGGSAIAVADNDELIILGSAQPEGDTSKPARSANPTEALNYTQIFRTPIEHTGTMLHTNTWTSPDDKLRIKAKKGVEHAKSIEYAFLLGKPSVDTTGSQPRRTTGGALHYITTNITDAGGLLTEAEWYTFLRSAFRYGSKSKLLLGSRLTVDVLNGFARGKVQTEQSEQTHGVRVFKYISPHGDVNLVTHDLLEGTTLGGYSILLDVKEAAYRPLQGRDTDLLENRQARDADTEKDEYLTEVGQAFGQQKAHALLTNVTS